MINLVPSAARKTALMSYWLRVVTVWLLLITGALVVSACTLLPTYVLIGSQVETFRVSANEASLVAADYQDTTAGLLAANQQADQVLSVSGSLSVLTVLEAILAAERAGIRVESVAVATTPTQSIAPVTVMGEAVSRQALADFRDRLAAESLVTGVELPIANLAQDRDIPFSISVTIASTTL